MFFSKYKLPNGNVFIWLGKTWGKSESVDNVLILEGGDVLFLETTKVLPLWKKEVNEDIKNLEYEEFAKKYELPANRDLWIELKEGMKTGKYPPFKEASEDRIGEFRSMISAYIENISNLRDPNEKIRQLEAIIGECRRKIHGIKTELSK